MEDGTEGILTTVGSHCYKSRGSSVRGRPVIRSTEVTPGRRDGDDVGVGIIQSSSNCQTPFFFFQAFLWLWSVGFFARSAARFSLCRRILLALASSCLSWAAVLVNCFSGSITLDKCASSKRDGCVAIVEGIGSGAKLKSNDKSTPSSA